MSEKASEDNNLRKKGVIDCVLKSKQKTEGFSYLKIVFDLDKNSFCGVEGREPDQCGLRVSARIGKEGDWKLLCGQLFEILLSRKVEKWVWYL